jgi:hypothetical protein
MAIAREVVIFSSRQNYTSIHLWCGSSHFRAWYDTLVNYNEIQR